MQNIAAIDTDSNAKAIGRADYYDGKPGIIENLRLPVRLGRLFFQAGRSGGEADKPRS